MIHGLNTMKLQILFLAIFFSCGSMIFAGSMIPNHSPVIVDNVNTNFENSIPNNFTIGRPNNMAWRNTLNNLGPIPAGSFGWDDTRNPPSDPNASVRRWGVTTSENNPANLLVSAVGYSIQNETNQTLETESSGNWSTAVWSDRIKYSPASGNSLPTALKLTFDYTPFISQVSGYETNGLEGGVRLNLADGTYNSILFHDGSFSASPNAGGEISTIITLDPLGISWGFQVSIDSWIQQNLYTGTDATAILGGKLSLKNVYFADGSSIGSNGTVIFESGLTLNNSLPNPVPVPEPASFLAWSFMILRIFVMRQKLINPSTI